jgi:fructokinase
MKWKRSKRTIIRSRCSILLLLLLRGTTMMTVNATTNAPPVEEAPCIIAAVEGGGTSFRVVVCQVHKNNNNNNNNNENSTTEILHRTQIDSSHGNPSGTLQKCVAFLEQYKPAAGYHAIGIATFGPVGLDDAQHCQHQYGRILPTTPKVAWRNIDVLTPLTAACRGPVVPLAVAIETDVNAPALAEFHAENAWRVANNKSMLSSLAYVTVGTGVGVGLVIHGRAVHGRMHPEGGHVPVQPLEGDTFGGYSWGRRSDSTSPFTGYNTVEGLASSVALTERLELLQGRTDLSRTVLAGLDDDHVIWDHAANALANLCVTLLLTVSVEKIVLGGGILQRGGLMQKVRARTVQLLNGYLELPEDMSELIAESHWAEDAGLNGAICLARTALLESPEKRIKADKEKAMKRTAFNWGMIHGVLAGNILTALAIKLFAARRRK